MDGVRWIIVLGEIDHAVFFSLRTTGGHKGTAHKVARDLIKGIEGASAGGHEATAGGRWELAVPHSGKEATEKLKDRFLKRFNVDRAKGIPIA
jgi:hypothetical protein